MLQVMIEQGAFRLCDLLKSIPTVIQKVLKVITSLIIVIRIVVVKDYNMKHILSL